MSRRTMSLWIQSNKTNDPFLNSILNNNNTTMIEEEVSLSQQQIDINNIASLDEFDAGVEDSDNEEIRDEIMCNRNKLGLFKRTLDVIGNDFVQHKKLHDFLSNMVMTNEINHNDNGNVLSNREKGSDIMISSNKVTNTRNKSCKRFKASYEM